MDDRDHDTHAAAFQDDFRENGYLADSMRLFEAQFRNSYPEHFAFVHRLNGLAQSFYFSAVELIVGRTVRDPLSLGLLVMPRVLSSFQAALLLAQRGMHVESLTQTRSVYEAGFWIGYLRERGDAAADQLISESARQEQEIHRLSLDADRHDTEAQSKRREEMARLGRIAKELQARRLEVADMARSSGFEDRYPEYRYLCAMAAHTSLSSISHYVEISETGSYSGHVIGPNEAEVPRAIMFAGSALLIALEALRRLTGLSSFDAELNEMLERSRPLYRSAIELAEGTS